ncbi:putative transporter small subunit [Glutamicibacter protophormiae]
MLALSLYVLIWPVIVAVVAVVICKGFISEVRKAKRRGEDLI